MSDNNSEIDIEWYINRADKLLDLAWDEYKQVTFDRNRIQHAILRNYLWLATAIFSAECLGFFQIFDGVVWFGLSLNANPVFNIFAFLSVACAFVTMAFGIDTMRDKDISTPFCGLGPVNFAGTAWN